MKKIEVNLQLRPSQDFLNKLLSSLLDYLLFSRSQIPFHFELFKKFVENKRLTVDDSEKKSNWKVEKQMKLANETLENILIMKQVKILIHESSEKLTVFYFKQIETEFCAGETSCFMILFGSTIHTPKESYEITFSKFNETLLPTFINETAEVRKILLRIIQNDDLKTSDKDQLPQTNVFILFKRQVPVVEHPDLKELRNFQLAKSCKRFSIHFRDSSDFDIFDENFQGLSLTEKPSTDAEEEEFWYQSKTFVKGFKDILVNNQSIWT